MGDKLKNIGLFFGSFNPVHVGHLALANYIVENSELNEIWFIVSPQNPFKQTEDLIDSAHRVNMLKLSIRDYSSFRVNDIELNLPTPSYTYKTLIKLKEIHPDVRFTLIMGSDNLIKMHLWREIDDIQHQCSLMVYPRPDYPTENKNLNIIPTIINAPLFNIDSTSIRKGLHQGKKYQFLIPEQAYQYIIENKLYGTNS